MAQATYTPTHCPQTGRKFTRAERKAANKAKFAASLASKPTKASKPKRKSAPKARKATPAQRVADRQDRTYHGRPDTPVTPQAEAHTADVDAARKAARETGARNRKRQAFDLATMWAFSTSHGGVYTEGQQAELTRLLGSADVSTYEDVVALTH